MPEQVNPFPPEALFDSANDQASVVDHDGAAAVVVASVRALAEHGKDAGAATRAGAVEAGLCNLGRHLDNLARFGVPRVAARNQDVSRQALVERLDVRQTRTIADEPSHHRGRCALQHFHDAPLGPAVVSTPTTRSPS